MCITGWAKFVGYGKLSRKKIDEDLRSVRVEVEEAKQGPAGLCSRKGASPKRAKLAVARGGGVVRGGISSVRLMSKLLPWARTFELFHGAVL